MNPVFTIGHSTRSLEDFLALLHEAGVQTVADVRRFPASRRHPQYNAAALARSLQDKGLGYRHFPDLGGRRPVAAGSANALWTQSGFRGYADYAMTAPFRSALDEFETLARQEVCAVMCAEALWWQCHRRIVADYLLADGFDVRHILGPGKIDLARTTPGAVAAPGRTIAYPASPKDDGHIGTLFDERPNRKEPRS